MERPDPADFEVTPEMVEAGCAELRRHDPDYESPEDAVRCIYRGMSVAAHAPGA
jgi:hypothetical protein